MTDLDKANFIYEVLRDAAILIGVGFILIVLLTVAVWKNK